MQRQEKLITAQVPEYYFKPAMIPAKSENAGKNQENLTEEEKIRLCECVTKGGADYIKTSTGVGTAGASLADIALFRKHIGKNVKIKAAGGIRTREDMEAFLTAGADRIGASGAIRALYGE